MLRMRPLCNQTNQYNCEIENTICALSLAIELKYIGKVYVLRVAVLHKESDENTISFEIET